MPGPGIHQFTFEAVDIVGNREKTESVNVIVDGKAPVTELEIAGPIRKKDGNNYAPANNEYFLFSTDDYAGVADVKYSLDGGVFKSYRGVIRLQPGEHTITYFAVDRAGNEEKKRIFKIYVDEAPNHITLSTVRK